MEETEEDLAKKNLVRELLDVRRFIEDALLKEMRTCHEDLLRQLRGSIEKMVERHLTSETGPFASLQVGEVTIKFKKPSKKK